MCNNRLMTSAVQGQRLRRRFGFDAMSQEEMLASCERVFAAHLGGHRLMANAGDLSRQSPPPRSRAKADARAWLNFRRVLCERWSHENLVLAGRCGSHRAFLGRLRHETRVRERHCAGRLRSQRADARRRLPALRTGASNRGAAASERGTELDRVVRAHRPLSPPRSGAVQLFAAHALATHQPREPAGARPDLARERRDVVRGAGDAEKGRGTRGRRCSRRFACATCV